MKRIITIAAVLLCIAGCKSAQEEAKVMVRAVPERSDDFVWENNLICYRAYGQALEGNPTSPGFDMWVKYPGKLVADTLYYNDVQADSLHKKSYHTNYGLGKDCYKVAVSLGAGSSLPIIENRLQFPATNYRKFEILEQTPTKAVFVLSYPEWEGDGCKFTLERKITVVADSYFCKAEDTYTFEGESAEVVGVEVGIRNADVMDGAPEEGWPKMLEKDRVAIWTPATDQSVEPEDGMIGCAIIYPEATISGGDHGDAHWCCQGSLKSGQTVTYWFGSCWSKGDIKTQEEWFDLVKNFKAE